MLPTEACSLEEDLGRHLGIDGADVEYEVEGPDASAWAGEATSSCGAEHRSRAFRTTALEPVRSQLGHCEPMRLTQLEARIMSTEMWGAVPSIRGDEVGVDWARRHLGEQFPQN